ncbi:hypothetical protein [Nonomuraea typhae]|uniref:hypothetical protein n=1 Tax=Nonomuraea typhae TaxID=2603600 RepID=UPI0012F74BF0|nr:hypothetical protein [Nonomuraea typhae]
MERWSRRRRKEWEELNRQTPGKAGPEITELKRSTVKNWLAGISTPQTKTGLITLLMYIQEDGPPRNDSRNLWDDPLWWELWRATKGKSPNATSDASGPAADDQGPDLEGAASAPEPDGDDPPTVNAACTSLPHVPAPAIQGTAGPPAEQMTFHLAPPMPDQRLPPKRRRSMTWLLAIPTAIVLIGAGGLGGIHLFALTQPLRYAAPLSSTATPSSPSTSSDEPEPAATTTSALGTHAPRPRKQSQPPSTATASPTPPDARTPAEDPSRQP